MARIKQPAKQRDHDERREKDHVIKRWKVFPQRNHGEEHDNQQASKGFDRKHAAAGDPCGDEAGA